MNARNQVLVVLTALMLVCSSGAMVTAAASGNAIQSSDTSEDEYDSANETANETVVDEQDGVTAEGDDEDETEAADNESAQQPAYVTFNDQTTDGETVVVANVTLASPGFVSIHDSSLLVGNVIDSVIGTSEYLEAGTHENVTVTLDDPLEESETLIAMPHRDTNQNETYDFVETEGEEDVPFLTPDGEPVTDEAVVTVEGAVEEEPADEMPAEDNVTEEEPAEDDMADDEDDVDDVTEEEPVEDDMADDEEDVDNVTEEVPDEDEMPIEEIPVEGEGQPVFITVENPTIEDVTLENVTAYIAVVGEDVDTEQIVDQIDDITDGDVSADNVTVEEMPADEEEVEDEMEEDEDNVTEEEPVDEDLEEDNVTEEEPVDEDLEEDNVTEEEPVDEDLEEDNVTEEEPVDEDLEEDNVTEEEEVEDELEATAFNISDLEAPDSATIGENITVTANVSNPTDEERTETIEFRLEGDLVADQNVTLESGDSEIVEFEVDTSDLEPGEYIHMVLGDEAGEVATIELTEADDVGVEEGVDETEDDTGLENETDEDEIGINETDDGFDDGADSGVTAD
ncbi:hypothetical protein [Natrinema hispanicum]|uniref:DUF7282 domain-containing protein n=1 Tax=Natrinema hispanicum TaxID=392421 RepID=A0A1G6VBT5_9EURY|nr:hypothetical protein [Natrinema hispanicum]SDD50305.1 hypothetical protein SAMN05192552_10276 [Natrinema hispanicum]